MSDQTKLDEVVSTADNNEGSKDIDNKAFAEMRIANKILKDEIAANKLALEELKKQNSSNKSTEPNKEVVKPDVTSTLNKELQEFMQEYRNDKNLSKNKLASSKLTEDSFTKFDYNANSEEKDFISQKINGIEGFHSFNEDTKKAIIEGTIKSILPTEKVVRVPVNTVAEKAASDEQKAFEELKKQMVESFKN